MKILALDLGDKWVGSAISDPLGITCKPFKTVALEQLDILLNSTLSENEIGTVVVGCPTTMSGGQSEQTKSVIQKKTELEQKFNQVKWILWDERLSSKRALNLQREMKQTKDAKQKEHSMAAAFILQSYLDHLAMQ
jgi:putative Holliday junction resolvase